MTERYVKKCSQCNCVKPISEFYMQKGRDGLTRSPAGECKICRHEREKKYREKNKEKLKVLANAYYKKNAKAMIAKVTLWAAENIEKVRTYKYRWKANNKDVIRQYSVEYYERTKKQQNARGSLWKKNNRDKANAAYNRYRARKISSGGEYTTDDIERIRQAQKDQCACCGQKLNCSGEIDHIVPLSRGGTNWPKNLQILCMRCNRKKSSKDPIVFMQSMGRLL